jgi:hypothetical protein
MLSCSGRTELFPARSFCTEVFFDSLRLTLTPTSLKHTIIPLSRDLSRDSRFVVRGQFL